MNAKTGKECPGDTVYPAGYPLVTAAYRGKGKQAGDKRKPAEGFDNNQQKNAPARPGADIVTDKQRKDRAKIDNRFGVGGIYSQ